MKRKPVKNTHVNLINGEDGANSLKLNIYLICANRESTDIIESCYCVIQFFHKLNISDNIFSLDLCEIIVTAAKTKS